jgi:hypothetical protein
VVGARRVFVAAWILLGVVGALNHTVFGRALDLQLPHLKYGHVMFNRNPRVAVVYKYRGSDGVEHHLADLMRPPSLGYHRSRLALSVATKPDYLAELCLRAQRGPLTFIVEEQPIGGTPSRHELTCDERGLH